MKRPLAFIAVLTLAACASIKDQPAPTPPPPANDCHCDDNTPDEQHGFAFKGRIVAVQADQGIVLVAFNEIPGALPAGTREFKAAPESLSAVQPGRDILARIEQRNGQWWLFDVRVLVPLPTNIEKTTDFSKEISPLNERQIAEFNSAVAADVVAARLKSNNWKFLGYSGGVMEPSFVPGLSEDEIKKYVESDRYEWEVFYAYHARFGLGSAKQEQALWDARMNYAKRVNRALLEVIKKREPNQPQKTKP